MKRGIKLLTSKRAKQIDNCMNGYRKNMMDARKWADKISETDDPVLKNRIDLVIRCLEWADTYVDGIEASLK